MFSSKHRLDATQETTNKKRFHTDNLILLVKPSLDWFRLRVVVSKKIDKRAVVRNQIRRRLKHAFRNLVKDPNNHKQQIVVITKPGIEKTSFGDLVSQIKKVINK